MTIVTKSLDLQNMTKEIDLKKELDAFKNEMKEIQQSFSSVESLFINEQEKLENLQHSFTNMIKLINHELIKSFDESNRIIEQ